MQEARDPFSGDPGVLIPAFRPDAAILHVQRSDAEVHAHCWGTPGVARQAALAAERVILVAEEIWPRERIVSDPGLGLAPALKVAAVVHEPFGACPSPVQGYYRRGHDLYHGYHGETRTVEKGFLSTLGPEAREAVRVKTPRLSEPLDYGA